MLMLMPRLIRTLMLYRLLCPLGSLGRTGTGGGSSCPSPLTLPMPGKLVVEPRCDDDNVVGGDRLPKFSVDDDLLRLPGWGNTLPFSELLLDSSDALFLSEAFDLRRMLRWSFRKDGMFRTGSGFAAVGVSIAVVLSCAVL